MHLFIHPELRQALTIMKFLKLTTEPRYLQGRVFNFTIALMKMTSAIYCEVILIIMISHVNDISDIIKDFVALGFIVEIDDMFAKNMKGFNVEEVVDEFKDQLEIVPRTTFYSKMGQDMLGWVLCRPKEQSEKCSKERMDADKSGSLIFLIYRLVNEFYIIMYFYSFFYFVLILNNFYYET